MESRRIAAGAALLTALLVFLLNSSVSSCVPDDFGKCGAIREHVRISWLGVGGKSYATLVLAANQNRLKENLLEFANIPRRAGWLDVENGAAQLVSIQPLRRTPDRLHLSQLTQVELDRAEAKILAGTRDESRNQAQRLDLIARERLRRVISAQLAVKPKPVHERKINAPVALAVSAPAAPVPRVSGLHPGDAIEPDGIWEHIAPRQVLWYRINSLQRLNVWVDTGGQRGIELAIFAPGTTDFWGSRPIGMGSMNRNEGHDLFWTGRAPGGGEWMARVTNHTDTSIPISVNFERVRSRLKDFCTSCHGNEFDFETCESKDPAFCEDFLPGLLQQ